MNYTKKILVGLLMVFTICKLDAQSIFGRVEYKTNSLNSGRVTITASADRLIVDWGDGSDKQYLKGEISTEHIYYYDVAYTITINTENLTAFEISRSGYQAWNNVESELGGSAADLNKNLDKIVTATIKKYGEETIGFYNCLKLADIKLKRLSLVTKINFSGVPALEHLVVDDIVLLRNIDLSGNPSLRTLTVSDVNLKSLDLSKNVLVEKLEYEATGTTLNIKNCAKLKELLISGNGQLQTVTLGTKYPDLTEVNCSNNNLSATMLNSFFKCLPARQAEDEAVVNIIGNPGTASCGSAVATSKGWKVIANKE
jgi:Leucine-rich repeat (LRR) protein